VCNSCQSFRLHLSLSRKPFNFGHRCFGLYRYSLTKETPSRSLVRSSCDTLYLLNGSIIFFTWKAFGRWSCLADCWWSLFIHQKFRCGGQSQGTQCCHFQSPTTFCAQNAATSCWFNEATHYAQEIETWLGSKPGRVVTSFVVSKLLGPAYRRVTILDASIKSFIKTELFPRNRLIFQVHEFACHGRDESQDKCTDGLAIKFQDREHPTFLSTTPVMGNL